MSPSRFTRWKADNLLQTGMPIGFIFAETPEERAEVAAVVKPLAEKYKGKVNFATIDAKAFGAHAGNLNLEVGIWPAFAIQETVKNQKFPFDQKKKITEKEIGKFVGDYLDGKIQPSIKSEPVPEKQEGPVTVIVANNYKDVVLNNEKDVLVEFYAPWCGHCKAYVLTSLSHPIFAKNTRSLAPKYDELAQLYTSNPTYNEQVTIAKVDATANDVPDEISGFPTIKLFVAGSKDSPIDYQGSRTVEDLAHFVKENGKYKVDAYVANDTDDADMTDADETMGKQAPAASTGGAAESVKSVASEAAEVVKTMVADSDGSGKEAHDEL